MKIKMKRERQNNANFTLLFFNYISKEDLSIYHKQSQCQLQQQNKTPFRAQVIVVSKCEAFLERFRVAIKSISESKRNYMP